MSEILANRKGISHIWWAAASFSSFYAALALVFELMVPASDLARILIRVAVVAIASFTVLALVLRKDTPKSMELRADRVYARYIVGSRTVPVSDIAGFEVMRGSASAGVTLYLADGRRVGFSDVEAAIGDRVVQYLEVLGVPRRPASHPLRSLTRIAQ